MDDTNPLNMKFASINKREFAKRGCCVLIVIEGNKRNKIRQPCLANINLKEEARCGERQVAITTDHREAGSGDERMPKFRYRGKADEFSDRNTQED